MRQVRLFALTVLAQAGFGLGTLLVVRWGFQSWPQGAYVWIPTLIFVAQLGLLVWLGHLLGAKGLPFLLAVAAWYLGRIAGVLVSRALPDVGLDASLLRTASFGALVLEDGRLGWGAPSLAAAAVPLMVLAAAYVWGRRGRSSADDAPGPEAGGGVGGWPHLPSSKRSG